MSSQSLCHVTGISMLRVLRTVRTPHERLETVYISWVNIMTATTPLPVCSVTQLDIWPSLREVTRMLLVIFLHHGNAQRNELHRTTSDPRPATDSSCTCGAWREPSRLACPNAHTSAENPLVNCTLDRHRNKNQRCHG